MEVSVLPDRKMLASGTHLFDATLILLLALFGRAFLRRVHLHGKPFVRRLAKQCAGRGRRQPPVAKDRDHPDHNQDQPAKHRSDKHETENEEQR